MVCIQYIDLSGHILILCFDVLRYPALYGTSERIDNYQKNHSNLNTFVFFNRGTNISVCVRRWRTGLLIEIRVPYEKVIRINSFVQSSLVCYKNRFLYFDVKCIYNYEVIAQS